MKWMNKNCLKIMKDRIIKENYDYKAQNYETMNVM